jgi:hypothetical protein
MGVYVACFAAGANITIHNFQIFGKFTGDATNSGAVFLYATANANYLATNCIVSNSGTTGGHGIIFRRFSGIVSGIARDCIALNCVGTGFYENGTITTEAINCGHFNC